MNFGDKDPGVKSKIYSEARSEARSEAHINSIIIIEEYEGYSFAIAPYNEETRTELRKDKTIKKFYEMEICHHQNAIVEYVTKDKIFYRPVSSLFLPMNSLMKQNRYLKYKIVMERLKNIMEPLVICKIIGSDDYVLKVYLKKQY